MLNASTTPQSSELNSAERLALAIVGKIGLKHHLTRLNVNVADTNSLEWLVMDITQAIVESLPHLDMMELERLHEGQPPDESNSWAGENER